MKAGAGLLLMLLGVSHAVETHCDGRKNGTQCYGALGGTLVLQLVDRTSDIFKFQLKLNENVLLIVKENNILAKNGSIFTPSDGTFRINNLSRSDGGEYELEIFNSQGQKLTPRTLQLFIQAPVSSSRLVNDCLSQGELKVSCLSEGGDSPEYSWTLDGYTLTDDKLLSGNKKNNTIILNQDVSGLLACSVKNNVSHVSAEKQMSTCGFIYIECDSNGTHISQWVYEANNTLCIGTTTPTAPDITVVMAGALTALLILLVVGIAVMYAQKKKKSNTNTPAEEAGEQELTYADVRILQRQGKPVKQREEVEVEYGQVKFSEQPRQAVEPAGNDCVYAMVRKDR